MFRYRKGEEHRIVDGERFFTVPGVGALVVTIYNISSLGVFPLLLAFPRVVCIVVLVVVVVGTFPKSNHDAHGHDQV